MKNNNQIEIPIKVYRNKTPGYCLIGAYLTVRNTYEKKFNPLKEEQTLYKKFGNKVSTLELIKLLKQHKYSTKIFSEKDYRFLLRENEKVGDLVKNYVEFIDKFNIYEETEIKPNRKLFVNYLNEGNLLLINGNENGKPHMRIIFGHKNDKFLVADSSYKNHLEISFNSLKKLLEAPFGFWMVATKPLR